MIFAKVCGVLKYGGLHAGQLLKTSCLKTLKRPRFLSEALVSRFLLPLVLNPKWLGEIKYILPNLKID